MAIQSALLKGRLDPRVYQIATLSALLIYGMIGLNFEVGSRRVIVILAVVLLTQWLLIRASGLPRFDPKSPLISGLSLALLLRTHEPIWVVLAAVVAIGSKFAIRVHEKHLFNPTNIGIVALMSVTDGVWVSPGQWGSAAYFGFLMACLGGLVVNRSARSDVTYAFLFFYLAILFGRSGWLGEPIGIPLHRIQNGAFLLFAFFMISDPKTTPDSRAGRILFAALVALGAATVHFVFYRNNGLLWSLALFSMATPVIDRLLPGRRYTWKGVGMQPKETATLQPLRRLV